ncbi:Gfo/Idh/MocA family protein [Winogradskyella sp. UBA3174]|uniref:Gfo/Idh/MocA family protein n=1 Tax=Winogradskyella sp. UBA3174 TaxID=1947785 RepID=UPI0025D71FF6|nr:Gfo/Idh/MocA family oxidoreductase [Winogradskyella sp. UBA3174]|tara:strand:+ start:74136 stop:75113 length:978 start_codon:yes stop_codon:yes gene_type:complete
MASKIINWGIIGAGKIASKFATDINALKGAKLYGIASRNLEKAQHFALKFNANKAYGAYKDLVLDPKIDAIYIATPHSFHKTHTLLCLDHKKPVLCEKPFAMNIDEVNEMIKASKENNTLLMEAMWTAFLPHFQYVQNLIHKKHFGNVIKLKADFGFFPEYDEASRLFNKSLGGGSLLDIGIYPVFAVLSTLGPPNSIEADATFFQSGADSECNIVFNYKDAKAILKSTLLEETKTEAIFYCDYGTIKINKHFNEPSTVILIDEHGNSEIKDFDYKTLGFSYEIEHFNGLIREGKTESSVMTFKRSQQLINTLDTIRKLIGLEYF